MKSENEISINRWMDQCWYKYYITQKFKKEKKTLKWKNLNISPNSIMSKYGQDKHIAQFQLH